MLLFWLLCTLIASVMYSDCLLVRSLLPNDMRPWIYRTAGAYLAMGQRGQLFPPREKEKGKNKERRRRSGSFFWICPHQNGFFWICLHQKKNPRYAPGRTGSESKLTQFQRFKISNYCARSCRRCHQPLQIISSILSKTHASNFPTVYMMNDESGP